MTRTNETHPSNIANDGRDIEFLRQQDRARAALASNPLVDTPQPLPRRRNILARVMGWED